jgi:hypothetical protein
MMERKKAEPVILPDVFDPTVPITELLPPRPPDDDLTTQHPQPSPNTGKAQPQKQPQTEPLDAEKDTDIGGDS